MKRLRCQLVTSARTATSAIFNGKTVGIPALRTFKREDLWTRTAAGPLVCQLYAFLMTLGTKASFDTVKLLFLLFKIIDVNAY
jgi:hypothetical protein